MYSKTIAYLEKFDNQHDFERMSADILNALGYKDVVLIAPRGGSDGGMDITFTTESGGKGLACVTLRKDIKIKFKEDFSQRTAGEYEKYHLFCTAHLSAKQKLNFVSFCASTLQAELVPNDIEALRSLLDNSDPMRCIRDQYLYGISNDIAPDDQLDSILLSYIDRISQLLKEGLHESKPNHPARSVARILTLTTLTRLDNKRKRGILEFLFESGLIEKAKFLFESGLTEKGKPIVELREANLPDIDLSGANFRGADLSGAYLTKANLSRANLAYTNLSGAYLIQSDLGSARLTWAKLIETDLSHAGLNDAELGQTDLSGAKFTKAECNRAIFFGANLSRADLREAIICDGADFSNAILREADLRGTHLKYANFRKADLSGANFHEADLSGAFFTDAIVAIDQLEKAKYLSGATMPDGSKSPW